MILFSYSIQTEIIYSFISSSIIQSTNRSWKKTHFLPSSFLLNKQTFWAHFSQTFNFTILSILDFLFFLRSLYLFSCLFSPFFQKLEMSLLNPDLISPLSQKDHCPYVVLVFLLRHAVAKLKAVCIGKECGWVDGMCHFRRCRYISRQDAGKCIE